MYRLENGLRIFIEKKLRDKYGVLWWEKGVSIKVRESAERNKTSSPDTPFGIICCTEFGDLKKIIMKPENWHDIFKEYFKTLEHIVSRLDELEPLRHTIAHTRLLSNEDYEKLEFRRVLAVLR